MKYRELYKLDSKGKTRVWYMEQDGDRFRTCDGVLDGKVKESGWKTAKPTNVGRSNERSGVEQAKFEIEARYTKQLKGYYYEDINDISKGCRYIDPMLADKYRKFAPGEAQPKMDGFRCILRHDGGWSREGELIPGARHLVDDLHRRGVFEANPNRTLDGELYNHDYADRFGELSSLLKKANPTPEQQAIIERDVQLHAYDMFDLTPYPFVMMKVEPRVVRRANLAEFLFDLDSPMFHVVESVPILTEVEYDLVHGHWVEGGFEGSMYRPDDGEYELGRRSKNLQKRKDFDDEEFDVVKIEEGTGNWAGAAKKVWCWLSGADRSNGPDFENETNIFGAGIRGSYQRGVELLSEQHSVVTVRFFGYTDTAIPKPRFGVVTAFHGAARTL